MSKLEQFGVAVGLTSIMMMVVTPFVHLISPLPAVEYVVGGQLVTLAVAVLIHGGTEFLVDGVLWDEPDVETVPEDPTEILDNDD